MNAQLHDEKATRVRLGGIGRSKFWELVGSGELRSVKIGKRRMVPEQAICEYIARLERQTTPASVA
jgi:excisionase family DNA binding protein